MEQEKKQLVEEMNYHYDKIKRRAYDEVIKRIYMDELLMHLEKGEYGGQVQKVYNEVKAYKQEKEESKKKDYYGFFTFNFKPSITLLDVQNFIGKLISKTWLSEWYYTIEQRGETLDELGKGIHIHFLFKRNIKPSHTNREIYNTFKKYTDTPQEIIFKTAFKYYPKKFLNDKLDYMTGKKWDEDKLQKVIMDKEFRKKNNLNIIYKYNDKDHK